MICEHCDTVLPDGHPVELGQKIESLWTWDYWADMQEGSERDVKGLGYVTLVAKNVRFGDDEGQNRRPAFLIFEVNGTFYRKNGWADSYGEVSWTGGFKYASKKVVTKEVWE